MALIRISKKIIVNEYEVMNVEVGTTIVRVRFRTRSGTYDVQYIDVPIDELTSYYKQHWVD